MAGLLEKDLRIILQRKQALVIFLFIAVVFGYTMDGTFILGYLPFLFMVMAVGTISYDEIDNGFMYLMVLPVDKKTYVKEKYLFCLGCGVFAWVVALVLYLVMAPIKGEVLGGVSEILSLLSFLCVGFIVESVMIPIQLKFGVEKSRVVMCVVAGAISALCFMIAKGLSDSTLSHIIDVLTSTNPVVLGIVGFIVTAIILFVSYAGSCKIMAGKEF